MKKISAKEHYDLLVQEGNDPLYDPPVLKEYMDKWDGQQFIDALALSLKCNVLEVGVGTGRLAKRVLETGYGYFTGIDISSATIERVKENLSAWDNTSFVQGDFIDYQFPQSFDIIYCSLTLFHFKDKKAFIEKVARILVADGRVVLSIPKQKETYIDFGSRVVELYPDDLDVLKSLLLEAGMAIRNTFDTEFAHILVAEKLKII